MNTKNEGCPKLSVCPPLIPDRKGKKFTFLESILVAHELLQNRLTVAEFLEEMLIWTGRQGKRSDWYLQNVLNAYYLVGLIPHIQLTKLGNHILASTFIEGNDLQEIRYYCLNCMTERLDKMLQFWFIARSLELFDTDRLSQSLGISYEDAKRRIRLLRNLGALQKTGNEYHLSPLGRRFASSIKPEKEYEILPQTTVIKEPDVDQDTFGGFIEW
jgi:hypothetical protein